MFVILTYDINEKRVNKIYKIIKKYLTWIQNSVFEGEITESKFAEMQKEIKKVLNPEEDSLIIYKTTAKLFLKKDILGIEKNAVSFII